MAVKALEEISNGKALIHAELYSWSKTVHGVPIDPQLCNQLLALCLVQGQRAAQKLKIQGETAS